MTRDLAKAIALRQAQIDKLRTEIDALNVAGKILVTPGRPALVTPGRPAKKRGPAAKPGPRKRRRKMSLAEKKVVSERMRAYWAKKRKKDSKK